MKMFELEDPSVGPEKAGISGPVNIENLAILLGVKNVSVFSQAIHRLINPPAGSNMKNISTVLSVQQMAELSKAFYLLLTDTSDKKLQIFNQIKQVTGLTQ